MRAGDVLEHPMNPKIHPEAQLEPLRGILEEVGKADVLRAYYSARNGGKLTYWDGHARQSLDPNEVWHVAIYDFDDAEADLLIATFDPIGWAAETSRAKLDELLRGVSTGNAAVQGLLSNIAESAGLIPAIAKPIDLTAADNDEDPDLREEGIVGFKEDAIFSSSNEWGLPDIREDMLSDLVPHQVWAGEEAVENAADWIFMFGKTGKHINVAKGGTLGFYIDDYKFEQIWTDAVKYVEEFATFGWGAVIAPDFSVWRDDPLALQIFNTYRARWCARYWQEAGVKVIPSLNFGDERTHGWIFKGYPRNAPVVSVQCRTTRGDKGKAYFLKGAAAALEELKPQTLIVYGGNQHRAWIEPNLPGSVKYVWLSDFMSERMKKRKASQ